MDDELPAFFFRIRDNGAAVFRVDHSSRNRRLDFEQIAVVNTRNGEIKPQGGQALEPDARAAIEAWLEERQSVLAHRARDEVQMCIEGLNRTAQWAQSKADPADLAAVTEHLLLAMHDLRTVLLRKKADRIAANDTAPDPDD